MAGPIIAAVLEVVKETAKEAVKGSLREGIERVREKIVETLKEGLQRFHPAEFRMSGEELKRFGSAIDENEKLKNRLQEVSIEAKSGSLTEKQRTQARLRNSEPNLKGWLGEGMEKQRVQRYGSVECQVTDPETGTIPDIVLTSNVRYNELSYGSDGALRKTAVLPESKVVYEVKNGSLQYLQSEIGDGHLEKQISGARNLGERVFVSVPKDVFSEIPPSQAREVIRRVREMGAEIAPSLPTRATQFKEILGRITAA